MRVATDVEVQTQTDITREDIEDLPFRELLGLDKALKTIQGNLELNLARLNELDEQIQQKHKEIRHARLLDNDDAVRNLKLESKR